MKTKVVIAGGGIAGLTTAIALRRIGGDVEIYDRASELHVMNGAIVLWPNATQVLKNVGVLDALIPKSDPVTHCVIRSWKGHPIKRWNVPKLSTPAIFIHRADVQSTLLAALPAETVHLGHTVDDFDQSESKVFVHFTSGRTAEGDVLIGTDGVRSRVRELLFGKRNLIYQGYSQWSAILDGTHELLRPGLKMEWWGYGVRFGIGANGRGRMNWYLSVNRRVPEVSVGDKGRLLEWVRGWGGPAEEIIRFTPEPSIIKVAISAPPPSGSWGRGRVTLLGDAAHPPTPNLGQGACMAIEDAYCLASCLERDGDAVTAVRHYEHLRKRRTATTMKRSWLVGRLAQLSHPALVAARTFFLKAYPLSLWERQLKSLHSYQVKPA